MGEDITMSEKDIQMTKIKGQQFDEERALYGVRDTIIKKCVFAGEADGESALKEAKNIKVNSCSFNLRYPLWHVKKFTLKNSDMSGNCRAPIWYSSNGKIKECMMKGIKTLRECKNISIDRSSVDSAEFGWKCKDIVITNSDITSEYLFFDSKNITLQKIDMKGKYSFQYIKNLYIENSTLDTKDAFWHSKNVVVKDSVIKGEYLGWFSEGLTLVNCKIIGTQPLCYCKNLVLVDCTMENCDLAFEYSEVEASIIGNVDSIKNPREGIITVDSVGKVIMEDAVMDCKGSVVIR